MKRVLSILAVSAAIALAGCASPDYQAYAKAHEAAQVERSKALATIAASGSDTAKVAAAMALALGGQQPGLQAPRDGWDRALQALGIVAPLAVQAYGVNKQTALGIRQSDNAAATAASTNAAFVGLGGLIQAPGATTTYNQSFNDSTHVPTVVTQPAPVVVSPVTQVPVTAQ